ncbi:MAG: ABC transporter permease [Pseudomonadota bacterium]
MKGLIAGATLTGLMLLTAALSLIWLPYDITVFDIAGRFQPPGAAHLFGTDQYGRDVLALVMNGAQTAVSVSFLAVGLGMGVGVPLGLLAAAHEGWVSSVILRGNDVIFAFPALLLAVLISAVRGPGVVNAVIAVGVFNIPVFAQLTRGAARSLWQRDFVRAAQTLGKGKWRVSIDHILPNIAGILIIQATIQIALAIAAEAALSYIGIGAQSPTASWGRMLQEAQTLFGYAPWLLIFPGLAILLSVFGLTLLGDSLRTRLDPQQRRYA